MALGRVKTWIDGEVLTAADLNGEFNNVLNNPITLISPSTGPINFNLQAHTNFRVESVAVAPGTAAVGRILFNTATSAILLDNGTAILSFFPSGVAGGSQVGSRVRGLEAVMTSSGLYSFSAEEFLMRSTDSLAASSVLVISTSLKTINIAATGPAPGGKDTSATAASSGSLFFYAISTGQGSTCLGILSTRPPAEGPSMPSSYSHFCYLATIICTRSSGAPLSPTLHQRGSHMMYAVRDPSGVISTDGAVLTSGASTATEVIPLAQAVPFSTNGASGTVMSAQALATLLVTASTVSNKSITAAIFNTTTENAVNINMKPLILRAFGPSASSLSAVQQVVFEMDVPTAITTSTAANSANWAYAVLTTATTNEDRGLSVDIMSYRVSNGDV